MTTELIECLTQNRKVEAAITQLASVLAWATECQLATIEDLTERKTFPKNEFRRHLTIAETMLLNCHDLGIPPGIKGVEGYPCPRLGKSLTNFDPKRPLKSFLASRNR